MCSLVVIDALSAKITLAALGRALETLPHDMMALIALELFLYVFDATKVGYSALGEMIGFSVL